MSDTWYGKMLDILEGSYAENAGAIRHMTLDEYFFFRSMVFSYEDYMTFAAGETKKIIVDPTGFEPLGAGVLTRIPFQPIGGSATSGPIRIQFYTGPTGSSPTSLLGASNRDATHSAKPVPDTVLELYEGTELANVTNDGIRFAGDLIPATGTAPATASNSVNIRGLPFAISNLSKYMITLTNDDGNGVLVNIKLSWSEILAS